MLTGAPGLEMIAMKRLDVVAEELWTPNSMGPFDFGLWPLVAPKNLFGSLSFLFL